MKAAHSSINACRLSRQSLIKYNKTKYLILHSSFLDNLIFHFITKQGLGIKNVG